MPRPEIKGLKYFPLDIGFFGDKKIRLLRGEHGSDGIEVYLRLLGKCYEDNGYYLPWVNDEDYALLADDTGFTEDKIRMIVSSCLRRSLFNDKLFKVGNVLTSRGIQRRYFMAIRDTKVKAAAQGRYTFIDKDVCLLTEEDFSEINKSQVWLKLTSKSCFSEKNSDKSGINTDKSENNPLNEMKGNKMKGKKTNGADAPSPPNEKDKRHKYGEYGWVRLTDDEYARLVKQYGKVVVQHYIRYVDESAQQTGNKNKWKDWNLTVRKAIRNKWGGDPPAGATSANKNYDGDEDFFRG